MIKCNRCIQKRLNININNYKEYCETCSTIEIEIKTNHSYGQFINYQENINDKYFHIYFNDNKEEVKREYIKENDNVKKINIRIDYQISLQMIQLDNQ